MVEAWRPSLPERLCVAGARAPLVTRFPRFFGLVSPNVLCTRITGRGIVSEWPRRLCIPRRPSVSICASEMADEGRNR